MTSNIDWSIKYFDYLVEWTLNNSALIDWARAHSTSKDRAISPVTYSKWLANEI